MVSELPPSSKALFAVAIVYGKDRNPAEKIADFLNQTALAEGIEADLVAFSSQGSLEVMQDASVVIAVDDLAYKELVDEFPGWQTKLYTTRQFIERAGESFPQNNNFRHIMECIYGIFKIKIKIQRYDSDEV